MCYHGSMEQKLFGLAHQLVPDFTAYEFFKILRQVMHRDKILRTGDFGIKKEKVSQFILIIISNFWYYLFWLAELYYWLSFRIYFRFWFKWHECWSVWTFMPMANARWNSWRHSNCLLECGKICMIGCFIKIWNESMSFCIYW